MKAYVRATKPALIGGLIVVGIMFVFGLVFLAYLIPEGDSVGPVFVVGWLFIVGLMAGMLIRNLRRYDKDAGQSLAEEIVLPDGAAGKGPALDFDQRLRKLEGLKSEGLISEDEYKRKRAEILDEKW